MDLIMERRLMVLSLTLRRKRADINMTEGPLLGNMILFTLPVLASGVLQLMFNAADVMVVGQFAGDAAMAAVGCCGSLINLIVNLFIGLSVGAGVVAAQDIGAKRYDEVRRLTSTALTASLVGGVVVGVFGFLMAEPLLALMDTPEEVLSQAVPYMRAYFCGMPGCLVYNYLAAILRSNGDTRRPLYFLTAAGVANVVLNLVMVLGFHMGAMGVGIATAASQYVAAGLTVVYMARMQGYCKLTGIGVDGRKLLRMVTIGLPAGLQGCMFSFSNVLIQSTINAYANMTALPQVIIAGNAAAGNLEGFVYTAMNSVYHTALTFVGQNIGAAKYERIKKIALLSVGMVAVIGLTLGLSLTIFGDKLLLLYAGDENRDAVIAAGVQRLTIIATPYVLCGLMDVGCGLLRGMGKAIQPMIVSLLGSCVFRIVWVKLVCPHFMDNISVLYISYPISWILTAAVHYICFVAFYRLLIKKGKLPNV